MRTKALSVKGPGSRPGVDLGRMIARAHGAADGSDLAIWAALLCEHLQDGHVFLDIDKPFEGLELEYDGELPSLEPQPDWLENLEPGNAVSGNKPLVLSGRQLWLARYCDFDQQLKQMIDTRRKKLPIKIEESRLRADLLALFPVGPDLWKARGQLVAAATLADLPFALLTGGPGTGKTTSLAKLLVLYLGQTAPALMQPIFLLAPTGKATARLKVSLRKAVAILRTELKDAEILDRLEYLDPDSEKCLVSTRTIHGILSVRGSRREGQGPFWYDQSNRLKASVVIVDEVSMVDLALMARLCEAVPDDTPFILVGDAEQLESVEAGSVLPDIVKNRAEVSQDRLRLIQQRTGIAGLVADDANLHGSDHVRLTHNYRFEAGSPIGPLAAAVNQGKADEFIRLLGETGMRARGVSWIKLPADGRNQPAGIREAMTGDGAYGVLRKLLGTAGLLDSTDAVKAFDQFRVLCAIRKGPDGADRWNERLQKWVVGDLADGKPRAVMITINDASSGLCNGDTGLVLPSPNGPLLLHSSDGRTRSASLLPPSEHGWAITIHKSQGSEYDAVAIVVPRQGGRRLLTRRLLYTALTRAMKRVVLVATESALRDAIG